MNWKYTDQDIIDSARPFKLFADWRKAESAKYLRAFRRGLIPRIKEFLTTQTTGAKPTFTKEQLIEEAKQYKTREEWRQAGLKMQAAGHVSSYNCALHYGADFIRTHCSHLVQRQSWTDDDLIASAAKYKHPGGWKRSPDRLDRAAYQAAKLRPEIFIRATAHMTPAASPYSGDYIIYAYEFSDRHVYVGLTMRKGQRHSEHKQQGPVQVCPEVSYKVLQENIPTPALTRLAEHDWQKRYIAEGWTPLWTAKAGSLGTVRAVKWTKELILAEAKKYQTKQEWIDKSQFTYRIAKREGWFTEASAHMPKRVLGIGVGLKRSDKTCNKMSQSAKRRANDPAWRAAHSASLKGRKLTDAHRAAIRQGMVATSR